MDFIVSGKKIEGMKFPCVKELYILHTVALEKIQEMVTEVSKNFTLII